MPKNNVHQPPQQSSENSRIVRYALMCFVVVPVLAIKLIQVI